MSTTTAPNATAQSPDPAARHPDDVTLDELLAFIDPARLHVQDDDSRDIDPRPLCDPETDFHERLMRTLRSLGYLVANNDARPWRLAFALYLAFVSGFWRRDPRYQGKTFFEFACSLTGSDSRTRLDRLRIVGQYYTLEAFLNYRKAGASVTAMAELYRADPRLWDPLRKALLTGLTVHDLSVMRISGELTLLKQDIEASKTDEERSAELDQEMARARTRDIKRRAGLRSQKKEQRRNGPRDNDDGREEAPPGPRAEDLRPIYEALAAARARVQEQAREAEALRQQVQGEQERLLAERRAALEDVAGLRRQLDAGQAQLAADRQALGAQAEALRQREQALSAREQLLQQTGGGPLAEAVEQRWQEAQAALAHLARSQHDLSQREAGLQQRETELADYARQAEDLAAGLEAQEAALQVQRAELDQRELGLATLAAQAQDLAQQRLALAEKQAAQQDLADSLAQQREQLADNWQRLQDALDSIKQDEAELGHERHRVEVLQGHLEVAADRLLDLQRGLRNDQQVLKIAEANLAQIKRSEHGLSWPDHPLSCGPVLMCLHDLLYRVVSLAKSARHFADQGDLPQKGVALLLSAEGAIKCAQESMEAMLDHLVPIVTQAEPQASAAFVEEYRKDPAAALQKALGAPPLLPTKLRPGLLFRLPIRAILGAETDTTPQQGVLAVTEDGKELITLDMNQPQAMIIAGQIGSGKTNDIGVVLESGLFAQHNLCNTKVPYLPVVVHYDVDPESPAPRWANYFLPNDEPEGVKVLKESFGAEPAALPARKKIVLLPPLDEEEWAKRQEDYPGMELRPLKITRKQLTRVVLRLILGTHQKSPLYMAQIGYVMEKCKDPQPEKLLAAIRAIPMREDVKQIVEARLVLLERLLGEEDPMADVGPGDFVGVDMRASYMDEGQAMGIMAVLAHTLSNQTKEVKKESGKVVRERYLKILVFDEAHQYMGKGALTKDIIKLLRQIRHRRVWVVFACQDPETLHPTILELSTIQVVHQTKSKESLKYLAMHCAGWDEVTVEEMAALDKGWAMVMTTLCANGVFRKRPQKGKVRPTASKPIGTTLTALPVG